SHVVSFDPRIIPPIHRQTREASMKRTIISMLCILCAVTFAAALTTPARAQLFRSFVAQNGNDGNDCATPFTACNSFTGALAKTSSNGEIFVVDGGGYGKVTINKAISIVSVGAPGAIRALSGAAITVNAGTNDVVIIRGLTIDGGGAGAPSGAN